MWSAKVLFSAKGTLLGSKAKEYGVSLFGHPLTYSYQENHIEVQVVATVFGEQQRRKGFLDAIRQESRVIEAEINGDILIARITEARAVEALYSTKIYHLSPTLIDKEGIEQIHIASSDRELLLEGVNLLRKNFSGKLLSLKEIKPKSISIVRVQPELTDKQKEALQIAIEHQYYSSPRKVHVKDLAKIAGLSFSTFQVHLRKAEEKVIPFYYE